MFSGRISNPSEQENKDASNFFTNRPVNYQVVWSNDSHCMPDRVVDRTKRSKKKLGIGHKLVPH